MKKIVCFISVLCGVLMFSMSSFALNYELTDLGTFGGSQSWAAGINDSGQVVGAAQIAGDGNRAFIWDSVNGMQNILSGYTSYATAISNDSYVTGYYDNPTSRAFKWSSSTGANTLYYEYSQAYAVNNGGIAAGHRNGANPTYWNASGVGTSIALYSGRNYCVVLDLNSSSAMVGRAYNLSNGGTGTMLVPLAVYWTSTSSIGLFNMLSGGTESFAYDINPLGNTVGYSNNISGINHAVLWETFSSAPIDLGEGEAYEINSDGNMVLGSMGTSVVAWIKEDGIWSSAIDLNSLLLTDGWTLTGIGGINSDGLIAATATDGVNSHAVLLTPSSATVPEPLTIFLTSLALLGLVRRKK